MSERNEQMSKEGNVFDNLRGKNEVFSSLGNEIVHSTWGDWVKESAEQKVNENLEDVLRCIIDKPPICGDSKEYVYRDNAVYCVNHLHNDCSMYKKSNYKCHYHTIKHLTQKKDCGRSEYDKTYDCEKVKYRGVEYLKLLGL